MVDSVSDPATPISSTPGGIIVLGMHRSGTSCLTGCLVLAGAHAGYNSDLTGVSEQNPKGFWERRDLRNFCDALLQGSAADWWRLSDFSLDRIPADVRERAFAIAQPALQQLEHHRPWVAKEPRLCILLPVFLELVSNPVCVHVVRNPLETARSLRERNGIPIQQGIALWEFYNQMAVRNSERLGVVRVSQSDLISDPEQAMARLLAELEGLGISGLHEPNRLELQEFVDVTLHRQQSERGEERAYLTQSQRELWELLNTGERIDADRLPPLSSAMFTALGDLETTFTANLRVESLERSLKSREIEMAAENRALKTILQPLTGRVQRVEKLLEADIASLRKANQRLTKDHTVVQIQLGETKQTLSESQRLSGRLERALAEAKKQAEEQRRQFLDAKRQAERERDQLSLKLDTIESSRSWRVTRPLRELAQARRTVGWFLPRLLKSPGATKRLYRDYRTIVKSPLFDRDYYLADNPDVGRGRADPALHFLLHGGFEKRNPSLRFSVSEYLERNADVAAERINPLVHYLRHGQAEGRSAYPVDAGSSKTGKGSESTPTRRSSLIRLRSVTTARHLPDRVVSSGRSGISVDVVVPVHNALDDVTRCLQAVRDHSSPPCRLILVNDGSDEPTSTYLREFAGGDSQRCTLIEHERAQGYTKAANAGMRRSTADYVVLLNSDTIVPTGWLERLLECGESGPAIGIVGPLSNAASYQSVPRLRDRNDWIVNTLPPGVSVNAMASLVDRCSEHLFPRVRFLNGFCYAIKRKVIESIGLLDEENFPRGYGEENDYSLRARDAGFELAVADNLYVFHAKSKSYTHETRRELAAVGRKALDNKHGAALVLSEIAANEQCFESLTSLRQMLLMLEETQAARGSADVLNDPPLSVLFLLMGEGGGGGGHSIVQEASGFKRLGIHTAVAAYERTREHNLALYKAVDPDLFFFFEHEVDLIRFASRFTIVVATHFKTMDTLGRIHAAAPHVMPVYYVQDYEPWIVPENRPDLRRQAEASYTAIPSLQRFAKTDWIREAVRKHHSVDVDKVVPSLDSSIYNLDVAARAADGPVHVVAMVRASTPRRSPLETMRLLSRIREECGDSVRLSIFGTDPESSFFDAVPDFEVDNYGVLTREEVATLLGSAHIFIDLSTYQAFGRTGLEAMAVGCVPVLPSEGGVREYAVDRENSRIVDTRDAAEALTATLELVRDAPLRERLADKAVETASRFSVGIAALSELLLFQRWCLDRMVTIVVPVFNAHDEVVQCLESVVAHTEGPYELVLIDDGSTDPAIWPLLEQFASRYSFVRALRNPENLGYTRTVNIGCSESRYDVVLLNSDTLVTPRWMSKLRQAASSRDRVATVTPVSNAAGAFSVPVNNAVNPLPLGVSVELMSTLVEEASDRLRPSVPTGNGFCLYIRRQVLDSIGLFDEEHFPRGYGEENDFCMRALEAGYENLIDDSTFVFHHRSASFGDEKVELSAAGSEALLRLHPDYKAKIRSWLQNDPLDPMRMRLETLLEDYSEAADLRDAGAGPSRSILYVLHNGRGGTLFTTLDLLGEVGRHHNCHVLQTDVDTWQFSRVANGELADTKTIRFSRFWSIDEPLDGERRKALKTILRQSRPDLVHIRHLIGNHPSVISLLKEEHSVPVVVSIHDMYSVCPNIQLFDDMETYCEGFCSDSGGECQVSRRWFRRMPPLKHAYVHVWREQVGHELAKSDALVVSSESARQLIRLHHPFLRPERFHLIPHGRDLDEYLDAFDVPDTRQMTVVYFGALGPGKGVQFVHEMLKLNNERGRPIALHILGDANLPFEPDEFGAVYHGPYERDRLPEVLSSIRPAVAILPSIGPETYCHALTEAWACGVPVLGSSLGAVGERLQAGGGWILPPTNPAQWLDKLVSLAGDPSELSKQHDAISQIRIPSVAEMSDSYVRLYRHLLRSARFAPDLRRGSSAPTPVGA